jgi:hypothetical protein
MLDQPEEKSQIGSSSVPSVEDTLTQVRGKYAFVQTSVDEFLKCKHEDLDLEDPSAGSSGRFGHDRVPAR